MIWFPGRGHLLVRPGSLSSQSANGSYSWREAWVWLSPLPVANIWHWFPAGISSLWGLVLSEFFKLKIKKKKIVSLEISWWNPSWLSARLIFFFHFECSPNINRHIQSLLTNTKVTHHWLTYTHISLLECRSVLGHLPSIHQALGSIPTTMKKNYQHLYLLIYCGSQGGWGWNVTSLPRCTVCPWEGEDGFAMEGGRWDLE